MLTKHFFSFQLYVIFFNVVLYAGDTVVIADNVNDLQNNLSNFAKYCKTWKLKINVIKTKIVIFGNRGRANNNFNLDGNIIEIVESCKYLGIILKQYRNFADAVSNLVPQAERLCMPYTPK